ncbi:MAG: phosphoglycerate kinase, partial [Clostridiales bacterium]|nr:phosphoglycerate kinase [Clostridiales bacterium]
CMGFLMQVEVEYIYNVIMNAKKPVMTIKSMAAGRTTPFVGLTFSYSTLRPTDMVTVGCFNQEEVHEDVEIALATLERRAVSLSGRNSPKKSDIMQEITKGE